MSESVFPIHLTRSDACDWLRSILITYLVVSEDTVHVDIVSAAILARGRSNQHTFWPGDPFGHFGNSSNHISKLPMAFRRQVSYL